MLKVKGFTYLTQDFGEDQEYDILIQVEYAKESAILKAKLGGKEEESLRLKVTKLETKYNFISNREVHLYLYFNNKPQKIKIEVFEANTKLYSQKLQIYHNCSI